ncbi:MAG: ribbon-helix-helix protein, CopG family [Actinomycetota bacterium]
MRTTIEITREQHLALTELAAKRGIRGFSPLVREAIDFYLRERHESEMKEFLELRGSISDEDADEMKRRIDKAWATWQPADW